MILHVGADGTNDLWGIRLLKEVIQLFQPPTYEPDPDTPGYTTKAADQVISAYALMQ